MRCVAADRLERNARIVEDLFRLGGKIALANFAISSTQPSARDVETG
jgi:hypothetical protein